MPAWVPNPTLIIFAFCELNLARTYVEKEPLDSNNFHTSLCGDENMFEGEAY
jgi:hypothetical protein